MSTVAAKSPKKRKSMSNQENTPSKTPKTEKPKTPKVQTPKVEKVQTPKVEKVQTPKIEKVETPKATKIPKTNNTPSNGKQSDNQGKVANNKKTKAKTPVKKNEKVNGNTKVAKFKGTKILDGKLVTKRQLFVQKLKERSEKEGKDVVAKYLTEKMNAITSRPEMSKTGKKKYRDLKQLFKYITGVSAPPRQVQTKKAPQESNKSKKGKGADKPKGKAAKKGKKVKAESVSTEEEKDDEDIEAENGEDESIDDEESADGEESDDGDESGDDEPKEKKPKKVIKSEAKPEPEEKSSPTKNSRYVLFVGNIAYDTTREELADHFKRVGAVTDIRIPLHKETNKPRGFAYVELPNEASYQKALDLNGSQLKNRKIHIEYTQGGKKKSEDNKKEIKAKNFKLHAMRKQGQFGKGNKPQFKGKGKSAQ